MLLGWDAAFDATGWIPNISFAPRDQVNMRMSDGLSRVFAAVQADVESGHGGVISLDSLLTVPK